MPEISYHDIFATVTDYCQEKGKEIPPDLLQDFSTHLGEGEVKNLRQLTFAICKKIERLLASNPDLEAKYSALVTQIRGDVRWRLVLKINDVKDTLKAYLGTLDPGETWNGEALKSWKNSEKNIGDNLYQLIQHERGPLSLKTIEEILDEEAPMLLARNPFEKTEHYDWTPAEQKRVLKQFLATLPEGAAWKTFDLERWEMEGRKVGECLVKVIYENRGVLTTKVLKKILGEEEAITALARNPFEKEMHHGLIIDPLPFVTGIAERIHSSRRLAPYMDVAELSSVGYLAYVDILERVGGKKKSC